MVLEDKSYVPTLAIRPSEMNGMEYLPAATKNRMTPCLLLAPWANSSTLKRATDRVERAFINRHYFLDIDRDYQFTNMESQPQRELAQLLDSENGFANWLRFVAQHEWVWPCIQTRGQSEVEIRQQIEAVQELGRSYCMRIVRDRFPSNIEDIVAAFAAGGAADFVVIMEGGWTRDPQNLAVWFEGILEEALQRIDANIPAILSCTSIPKLFTEFSGITTMPFSNRQLIEEISRRTNRISVVYGDWGSTRPREIGGYASRPLNRIDYPTESAWCIARNKEEEWNFKIAASELIRNSGVWDGNLGIWGEEMIYQTTINEEIGIDTPQKNVAARVNIHLHRQAFYGQPGLSDMNFDEDWED